MLVVLVLAAAVILAGVVAVAMGYGGEMAEFVPDVPPLALPEAEGLGAADFMALQLPVSLVGYHTRSVDETLTRVARALSERDTRIAVLEQRVSEMLVDRPQALQALQTSQVPQTPQTPQESRAVPPDAPPAERAPQGPQEAPEPVQAAPESSADGGDGEELPAAPEGEEGS